MASCRRLGGTCLPSLPKALLLGGHQMLHVRDIWNQVPSLDHTATPDLPREVSVTSYDLM